MSSANQDGLGLAAVELEEAVTHPGLDVLQAVVEGANCVSGIWLSFDIDLSIISVEVEIDAVFSEDMTKWEQINQK